MYRYTEKN